MDSVYIVLAVFMGICFALSLAPCHRFLLYATQRLFPCQRCSSESPTGGGIFLPSLDFFQTEQGWPEKSELINVKCMEGLASRLALFLSCLWYQLPDFARKPTGAWCLDFSRSKSNLFLCFYWSTTFFFFFSILVVGFYELRIQKMQKQRVKRKSDFKEFSLV